MHKQIFPENLLDDFLIAEDFWNSILVQVLMVTKNFAD